MISKNNDLADLQSSLGYPFKNPVLLRQALVHSSYINENAALTPVSNERLEFLGDAVLGLVIGEKLYQDYPNFNEGLMTQVRAALVREATLTRIARTIKLGDHLVLGKGETASGGRDKPANLSAAVEALIAAVYLDAGLPAVRELVLRLFEADIDKAVAQAGIADYKSKLQELIQASYQQQPSYYLVAVEGPEHDRKFTIEVRIGDNVLGKGTGRSKKAAETEAAREALQRLLE